jgi:RNA polymerase sigma factor (sigma-70 family)
MDLSRLVEEHYPKVFRRLRALVGDRDTAEDLAQDVFAGFVVALRGGRRIESVGAYLNGMVNHVFCDHLRGKKSRPRVRLVEETWDAQPEGGVHDPHRLNEALLELVKMLPERQRKVIVGRFQLRMTLAELAEVLGRSERTISLWQEKAMRKLRQLALKQGIDLEQTP